MRLLYGSETTIRFNRVPMMPTHAARFDVLLVEDDADQLFMLMEMLTLAGYCVHGVANATEAIVTLKTARVDLLVSDIRLTHEMNGFELADLAQSIQPSLQAVFITGFTIGFASHQRAARPDAKILQKPFPLDALVDTVGNFLGDPVLVRPVVS